MFQSKKNPVADALDSNELSKQSSLANGDFLPNNGLLVESAHDKHQIPLENAAPQVDSLEGLNKSQAPDDVSLEGNDFHVARSAEVGSESESESESEYESVSVSVSVSVSESDSESDSESVSVSESSVALDGGAVDDTLMENKPADVAMLQASKATKAKAQELLQNSYLDAIGSFLIDDGRSAEQKKSFNVLWDDIGKALLSQCHDNQVAFQNRGFLSRFFTQIVRSIKRIFLGSKIAEQEGVNAIWNVDAHYLFLINNPKFTETSDIPGFDAVNFGKDLNDMVRALNDDQCKGDVFEQQLLSKLVGYQSFSHVKELGDVFRREFKKFASDVLLGYSTEDAGIKIAKFKSLNYLLQKKATVNANVCGFVMGRPFSELKVALRTLSEHLPYIASSIEILGGEDCNLEDIMGRSVNPDDLQSGTGQSDYRESLLRLKDALNACSQDRNVAVLLKCWVAAQKGVLDIQQSLLYEFTGEQEELGRSSIAAPSAIQPQEHDFSPVMLGGLQKLDGFLHKLLPKDPKVGLLKTKGAEPQSAKSKIHFEEKVQLVFFDQKNTPKKDVQSGLKALLADDKKALLMDDYDETQSVSDEPIADEPIADEPIADEPIADEPIIAISGRGIKPVKGSSELFSYHEYHKAGYENLTNESSGVREPKEFYIKNKKTLSQKIMSFFGIKMQRRDRNSVPVFLERELRKVSLHQPKGDKKSLMLVNEDIKKLPDWVSGMLHEGNEKEIKKKVKFYGIPIMTWNIAFERINQLFLEAELQHAFIQLGAMKNLLDDNNEGISSRIQIQNLKTRIEDLLNPDDKSPQDPSHDAAPQHHGDLGGKATDEQMTDAQILALFLSLWQSGGDFKLFHGLGIDAYKGRRRDDLTKDDIELLNSTKRHEADKIYAIFIAANPEATTQEIKKTAHAIQRCYDASNMCEIEDASQMNAKFFRSVEVFRSNIEGGYFNKEEIDGLVARPNPIAAEDEVKAKELLGEIDEFMHQQIHEFMHQLKIEKEEKSRDDKLDAKKGEEAKSLPIAVDDGAKVDDALNHNKTNPSSLSEHGDLDASVKARECDSSNALSTAVQTNPSAGIVRAGKVDDMGKRLQHSIGETATLGSVLSYSDHDAKSGCDDDRPRDDMALSSATDEVASTNNGGRGHSI